MKKCVILLLIGIGCAIQAQEIEVSTSRPPDSAGVVMDYYTQPYTVQRELQLLYDTPDQWREELYEDSFQSDAWQRQHGRLHTWRIGVDATTFLRNAEFFMPYTLGYTATGFFVTPYAKHMIGSDAQLTLGLQLTGVAGYDGLRHWQPLVRLEYEPIDNVRLVMGSIYGTLSHGLYEAMLDRERYIYDHQEEGVQILTTVPIGSRWGWESDTWLHWEELLEPWQPTQERFTMGSSHVITLWGADRHRHSARDIKVDVPLSFIGSHRGGQFSALDTCIQTLFNESAGLRVNVPIGYSAAIAVDLPVLFYHDMSPVKCMAYSQGWAICPQLAADLTLAHSIPPPPDEKEPWWHGGWHMMVHAGYWRGHQYIAPRGSYLFQSISWHRADFAVPEREMVTGKVAIENNNGNLSLGIDAELYYDLHVQSLDYAFGLYMRYTAQRRPNR